MINDVYIEVAANELFGVGDGGLIKPPNADKSYTLSQADIAGKLCLQSISVAWLVSLLSLTFLSPLSLNPLCVTVVFAPTLAAVQLSMKTLELCGGTLRWCKTWLRSYQRQGEHRLCAAVPAWTSPIHPLRLQHFWWPGSMGSQRDCERL